MVVSQGGVDTHDSRIPDLVDSQGGVGTHESGFQASSELLVSPGLNLRRQASYSSLPAGLGAGLALSCGTYIREGLHMLTSVPQNIHLSGRPENSPWYHLVEDRLYFLYRNGKSDCSSSVNLSRWLARRCSEICGNEGIGSGDKLLDVRAPALLSPHPSVFFLSTGHKRGLSANDTKIATV